MWGYSKNIAKIQYRKNIHLNLFRSGFIREQYFKSSQLNPTIIICRFKFYVYDQQSSDKFYRFSSSICLFLTNSLIVLVFNTVTNCIVSFGTMPKIILLNFFLLFCEFYRKLFFMVIYCLLLLIPSICHCQCQCLIIFTIRYFNCLFCSSLYLNSKANCK